MTTKTHGGKRKGSGRPATGKKETVVVRIDSRLLQAVNDLKKGVTINQDETKVIQELRERIRELENQLNKANNTQLEQKPVNASLCDYDGNAKEFRAKVGALMNIPPSNRTKFADKLKSIYSTIGITTHKNGQLSCDEDRLAIYEYLRKQHNG